MKVAHIAPPWISIPPKNYGGTEVVLYNLIEEQVAQGHDVTLFAPGDAKTSAKLVSFFPQSLIEAGVPWQGHLKAYYHLYKAVEYVKAHDFDILHTHLSSSADMYLFPLTAQLNTPHVTTLHSRFPFDRVQQWTGDADHFFMEWVDRVPLVAISQSAKDEVAHPLNFVGVVHHGLPMDQFTPTTQQPEDYFVWLGRFVPEKGAHLAIEAAKLAGVSLVLAGTIDPHIHESVHYFDTVVKPLIDGQQITYVGPVNMEQKIDLLSRARGFLNPIMWKEPFGMVMIEAMALGCPVIAFAQGAAEEIIVHNSTGFLVHNVQEMAAHIPLVKQLDRATARAHVERNFSVRAMVEHYTHIYKKVLQSAVAKGMHAIATAKQPTPILASTLPTHAPLKIDAPVPAPLPVAHVARAALEAEPLS